MLCHGQNQPRPRPPQRLRASDCEPVPALLLRGGQGAVREAEKEQEPGLPPTTTALRFLGSGGRIRFGCAAVTAVAAGLQSDERPARQALPLPIARAVRCGRATSLHAAGPWSTACGLLLISSSFFPLLCQFIAFQSERPESQNDDSVEPCQFQCRGERTYHSDGLWPTFAGKVVKGMGKAALGCSVWCDWCVPRAVRGRAPPIRALPALPLRQEQGVPCTSPLPAKKLVSACNSSALHQRQVTKPAPPAARPAFGEQNGTIGLAAARTLLPDCCKQ